MCCWGPRNFEPILLGVIPIKTVICREKIYGIAQIPRFGFVSLNVEDEIEHTTYTLKEGKC